MPIIPIKYIKHKQVSFNTCIIIYHHFLSYVLGKGTPRAVYLSNVSLIFRIHSGYNFISLSFLGHVYHSTNHKIVKISCLFAAGYQPRMFVLPSIY